MDGFSVAAIAGMGAREVVVNVGIEGIDVTPN
jgi:hypothetical protein